MSTDTYVDRPRLCAFTFGDGRRCRTPRRLDHPHLCYFHAVKEAQTLARQDAARKIAFDLSGEFIAFRDVNAAIAHTISAVALGHMKPKTATVIAYLCQSLVQSAARAESEYLRTFGEVEWQNEIVNSLDTCSPEKMEEEPQEPTDTEMPSPQVALPSPDASATADSEADPESSPEEDPELLQIN